MDLNPIIHQPVRLRIVAALASIEVGESLDFTYVRDLLSLTDGNLGSHLSKLEEAGYLRVDKRFIDRKPRTDLSLTRRGRRAFEDHVCALREILDGR